MVPVGLGTELHARRGQAAIDALSRHKRRPTPPPLVEPVERRILLSAYTLAQLGYFGVNTTGANPHSALVADANGNLYGTASNGGPDGDGTVFEIVQGSNTITALASFDGTNGSHPSGGLTLDRSGNLYGTTEFGGADGFGTVFEIIQGPNTITTLASFDGTNGSHPSGGLTLDSSGNLYGTTELGGAIHDGNVFEVASSSGSITTIASFDGTNGACPSGVTPDMLGNLFGTTNQGGPSGDGTVFEVAHGTGSINTLASFDGTNGSRPVGTVTLDNSGNLFGTTEFAGANNDGTVFEIIKGSGTIATLAAFNGTNGATPISSVTLDSYGNLYGTTEGGGTNNDGTVFEIAKGSGTIASLASFNGSDGANPDGAVTLDGQGNLHGTTSTGGTHGQGTVFEIAHGAGPITTLASFNGTNGTGPMGGLVFDTSGNLYGTSSGGGAAGDGAVFEITRDSGTIAILASFTSPNSVCPEPALTLDGSGDLYGTTYSGGASNDGTVFEIIKGSGTISTIASFNRTNGATPFGGLTMDGSGNLYSTTEFGGANDAGTVFEIVQGSGTITTLAAFDGTTAAHPFSGVTLDSSGDLYGATDQGGTNNDGIVFEIVKGSGKITTLASFDRPSDGRPRASVVPDSAGNVYGTTEYGGANDDGAVFEIVKGSGTITTVASFKGTDGANPRAGVMLDNSGDLYGTTYNGGGPNGDGTVFEIAKGSDKIDPLVLFNFHDGANPDGTVTLDRSGNLYGTTWAGGRAGAGTVFELSPAPLLTAALQVNDGTQQRSMVNSLTVTFGEPVTLDPGGLVLTDSGGNPVPFQMTTSDNKSYVLSFSEPQFVGGSLPDGRYVLSVEAGLVHDSAGLTPANTQSFNFFRLFGDYDGNGTVNNLDYLKFKKSYLTSSTDSQYLSFFDFDGSGSINNADYLQFKKRYLTMI